jgi:tRNA 2-(methylsulfanyl)-N6-isopentenyladenosine37 hydroxylase
MGMLHLLTASPPVWLPVALADLPALLLDHAHCEMKAAASALSFARRYPHDARFVADMRELAREEGEHYADVRKLLDARQIPWVPAPKDEYVVHLLKQVRSIPGQRLMDRLLIAAIIEARSCERLGLLAEHLADQPLRAFYRRLFEAEARHHGLFLEWARQFCGREATDERLAALVAWEAEYVASKAPSPHIHG